MITYMAVSSKKIKVHLTWAYYYPQSTKNLYFEAYVQSEKLTEKPLKCHSSTGF